MSFLKNHLLYCSGNEAPPLYHIFAGFSLLSSLVGRRVWIKQGIFTFYPNLYIILVGSPGGGKSTALDEAKKFVRICKTLPLSGDAMTVQALLRNMTEESEGKVNPHMKSYKYDGKIIPYAPISIFAGEFISFISMDPYGWITFLTTIYHEDVHEVKTKNKGNDLLMGPYITMLGCLTPDTQQNLLQQKVIGGGFSRRAIYVWASGRGEPIAFPEVTPEMEQAQLDCLEYGRLLQKVEPGPMVWSPEARAWYEPWYVNLRYGLRDGKIGTATTVGYYESKHVQLMKLAMLYSLSESTEKILKVEHFLTALGYLEETEKNLDKVFAGTGPNPHAGVAEKIMEILERVAKPMTSKELYKAMFREANREDIDSILHHLTATDRIMRWEAGQQGELVATIQAYREYKSQPKS